MSLFRALLAAGGPQGVGTITHVGTQVTVGRSGSATCSLPAGAAAGDLLIFLDQAYNTSGSPPTLAIPSGATQAGNLTYSFYRFAASRKILTAGDISAGNVSGMTAVTADGFAMVFRASGISIGAVGDLIEENQTSNTDNATLTLSGDTGPFIAVASVYFDSSGTNVPWPTQFSWFDGETDFGHAGYEIVQTGVSGANRTVGNSAAPTRSNFMKQAFRLGL